jgi:hypothetical protein
VRIRFAALLCLAFVACGDATGVNVAQGDFDVIVGAGTRPVYSWPGGTAFSVSVVRVAAPGTIVWGIANTGMTIPSPVTHGTVTGAGSVQTANAEPTLTAGVRYRVSITRLDQKTGFIEFTP